MSSPASAPGRHDLAGTEWWERIAPAIRAWATRHPLAARRLARARAIALWASLPFAVVVALTAPKIWPGLLQIVAILLPLLLVWTLSPTRTIAFSSLSRIMAVGVPLAFLISAVSTALARGVGLGRFADGGYIGIAGPVEEVGKLLPLAVLALLAPRLVRRWASVDWVLAGYACGLAFYGVEQGIRWVSLQSPSFSQIDYIISGKPMHPTPELVPFAVGLDVYDEGLSADHPIWSGLIGAAIGIALHLASRARSRPGRIAAWALPVGVAGIVVMWHSMSNGTLRMTSWEAFTAPGVPLVWAAAWPATGFGWPAPFLLVAFWIAALAIDVGRRDRASLAGVPTLDSGGEARAARLRSWATTVPRRALARVALAVVQWSSDLLAVTRPFRRRPGESRASALLRGRLRRQVAVRARRAAAAASLPAPTRAELRRARLLVGAVTLASILLAIVGGTIVASAVGTGVLQEGDFLSPLMDFLIRAWNGLPWWGQAIVAAGALLAAVWLGVPAGLAATSIGIGTYVVDAEHRGAAEMIRREGFLRAAFHYLSTRGPADMLVDLGELVLTFVPGARLTPTTGGGDLTDEVVEHFAQALGFRVVESHEGTWHELIGGTVDPLGPPDWRVPAHGTGDLRNPAASAAGWESSSSLAPPFEYQDRLVGVEGPLSGRAGFAPSTRYELPGQAFVYTDENGAPVYVEALTEAAGHAEWNATDGIVVQYPGGHTYGKTPGGELWYQLTR